MMFAGHDVQLSNAPPRGGRLRRWWRLPPTPMNQGPCI